MSTSSNRVVHRPQGAVIGWLVNPRRTRIQRGVDRRFDRARYDADRMSVELTSAVLWLRIGRGQR